MKTSNYIIAHKNFEPPKLESYIPLQVGSGKDLGWLRDNTGDEISKRNPNWCELTGLYWIWKNDPDSDRIGISHYRRYFKGRHGILSEQEEDRLLGQYDVLMAEFEPYRETVYEQYCIDSGFARDLEATRDAIEKKSPQLLKAFDDVMKQGGISQYNMLVCSRELYDQYCSWLFAILCDVEAHTDLAGYNDYQKRIYGFLAERLLNVYMQGTGQKICRLPVIQSEMSTSERVRLNLRRLKNRLLFRLKHH